MIKLFSKPFLVLFLIFVCLWTFLTRGWSTTDSIYPLKLLSIILITYLIFYSFVFNIFKLKSFLENNIITLFFWSGLTYIVGRLSLLNFQVILIILSLMIIPELVMKFASFRNLIFKINYIYNTDNKSVLYLLSFSTIYIVLLTWINGPYLSALYPDTTCDTSLVHMMLPRHYIENESIFNVWWTRSPFLPQFIHFLYLFPMKISQEFGLRYDLIPHLFSTFFIYLITVIFYKASNSIKISLLSLLFFITTPVVSWSMGTAFLDIAASMMLLCTLYYFYRYSININTKTLHYLGICLGLSFVTKPMLGLLIFPLGVIFSIILWLRNKNLYDLKTVSSILLRLSFFCALPIIVFCEFNFELTGNPIFPFLYRPIPNAYFWDLNSFNEFQGAINHWTEGLTLWKSAVLFIKIFSTNLSVNTDTLGSNLTPLLFFGILGPVILTIRKKVQIKDLVLYLLIIASFYMTWYFSSPVLRYLMPLSALLCISLAFSINKSKTVLIIFLLTMSYNIIQLVNSYQWFNKSSAPPLSKQEYENYLFKNTAVGTASQWLLNNSNPTDLVYTYKVSCDWLRIPRPFIGDWFGHSNYGDLLKYSKNNKFVEFMNERQISYIFDSKGNSLPTVPELAGSNSNCISEVLEASTENTKLYRFHKENPMCQKSAPLQEIDQIIKKAPKSLL